MIFPKPKSETYFSEAYELKHKYTVDNLMNFYHAVKNGNSEVKFERVLFFDKEEYRLNINEKGIQIIYSDDEGKFRAVTSLYQLLKKQNNCLQYAQIDDKPDFKRRGYMLDISRGRMPKLQTVEKIVDYLMELKYNELQLYMESFCFDYKSYPRYTADFDCWTPEDIKTLEAYCNERYIDLVPNQNSFGHMATWLDEEEFRHLAVGDEKSHTSTLNILLPETVEFLDNLYGSLLPLFQSKYVNIGMDEAGGLGKYQLKEYCEKYGEGTLFIKYLNCLNELIQTKYNKKVMFWADMLTSYQGLYENVPKNAIALEWGYEYISSQLMEEHCREFRDNHIDFYICPSCNTHNSLTGRWDLALFNIRSSAEIGKKYHAKGYLLTDWGDLGHPQFWVWSIVPVALGGQYSWNSGVPQPGWELKPEFSRASWDFADEYFFEGNKISETLSLMGNYYLLEHERVHNNTLTNMSLTRTLDTLKVPPTQYEDKIANKMIANYIDEHLKTVENMQIPFDWKRQIVLNARMVLLAIEFGNVRLAGGVTEAKKEELIQKIVAIKDEYVSVWNEVNHQRGSEIITRKLEEKIEELNSVPLVRE